MNDWNGDGREDWEDDALFHNVIEPQGGGGGDGSPPSGNSGCSFNVIWFISLVYLCFLLPGKIPVNGFTVFIGLICAAIFVIGLFVWITG